MLCTLISPAFASVPNTSNDGLPDSFYLQDILDNPESYFIPEPKVEKSILQFSGESRATTYTSTLDLSNGDLRYGLARSYDAGIFSTKLYNFDFDPTYNSGTLTVGLYKPLGDGFYNIIEKTKGSLLPSTVSRSFILGSHAADSYCFGYATDNTLAFECSVDMMSK